MRRRWLLPAAIVACAGLLSVVLVLRDHSHINLASFERIQVGMAEAEVEKILGGPSSGEFPVHRGYSEFPFHAPRDDGRYRACWTDGVTTIDVYFDSDGGVEKKEFYPPPSLWSRLKAWLGW
jgi:hypothetical protein